MQKRIFRLKKNFSEDQLFPKELDPLALDQRFDAVSFATIARIAFLLFDSDCNYLFVSGEN